MQISVSSAPLRGPTDLNPHPGLGRPGALIILLSLVAEVLWKTFSATSSTACGAGARLSSIAPKRVSVTLIGMFAVMALLLAMVEIYGVVSFSVARHTREIGARMAFGATRGDVLRMVVCEAMVMAAIGLGIGLAGSLAVRRFMSSLLFGVSGKDPIIPAAVIALLPAVALLASYITARCASSVDPIMALRCE